MKYEWLNHHTFQLKLSLFCFSLIIFFFGGKFFRFSTILEEKCVSASVFDFFCKRLMVKASFFKLVDIMFYWSFPLSFFLLFWGWSCKFVIMGGQLKKPFNGLWNNWIAWRRHLLLKAESPSTWWRGNINCLTKKIIFKFNYLIHAKNRPLDLELTFQRLWK